MHVEKTPEERGVFLVLKTYFENIKDARFAEQVLTREGYQKWLRRDTLATEDLKPEYR